MLPVDNLIGLPPSDPLSQPIHRRPSSSYSSNYSNGSPSPGLSAIHATTRIPTQSTHSMPIPRTGSAIHRPGTLDLGSNSTPLSHSPSSSESPFPFSPNTNSLASVNTNITSPPSSFSQANATFVQAPRTALTYPSVPPPSLSSSFGSPVISYGMSHMGPEFSPADPSSRRNSIMSRRSAEWRAGENRSRRSSVERGARVAETGSLVSRSRGGSTALPPTTETPDTVELNGTNDIKGGGSANL
jgi:hypothetical protein